MVQHVEKREGLRMGKRGRVKRGGKGGGLWWVRGSVKRGKKGEGLMLGKRGEGYACEKEEGIGWDLRDAKASLMPILGLLRSKS